MLNAIRKRSASFLVKAFLVVLILSFGSGIWMNWDVIRAGGGSDWALRVGPTEIPPETLTTEYEREVARLRAATNTTITGEQARAFGVPNAVMERLIAQALLSNASSDLTLTVDDAMARDRILNDETFRDPSGAFDRERYRRTLSISGLSEQSYEQLLKQDILRETILATFEADGLSPTPMLDALSRYEREQRAVDVVVIDESDLGEISAPTDDDLRQHYQDNIDRFQTPETRSITLVVLSPDTVGAEISVSDDEIAAAYEQRIDEFRTDEQRHLRQIILSDSDEAGRIATMLRQGRSFEDIAREDSSIDESAVIDLGFVTQSELIPALKEVAFALESGDVSDPVESPLGWHVVRVEDVTPASQATLGEVTPRLTASIRAEKAVDVVYELSTRLEDALAGGQRLEDAASALNIPVVQADIVADGQGLGDDVPAEEARSVAETVFALEAGAESFLTELGPDGYFIARVDGVTPPAPRPFDDVRDAVRDLWTAEQRRARLAEMADRIGDAVRSGTPLTSAAAEHDLEAMSDHTVAREGDPSGTLPRDVIDQIFAGEPGEPVIATSGSRRFVAVINDIAIAEPEGADDGPTAADIRPDIENDLRQQYLSALRSAYPIEQNADALNALFQ